MPRAFTPKILTANDLLDGHVIFLGRHGWVRDSAEALIAATPEDAARFEAEGAKERTAARVVDPYLVEVAIGPDGVHRPLRYREVIRTRGPTVRPDLGPQAAALSPDAR